MRYIANTILKGFNPDPSVLRVTIVKFKVSPKFNSKEAADFDFFEYIEG